MDGTGLWIVGALALVIVVAALIWVLRRGDTAQSAGSPDYGAPEVTLTGQPGASAVTFGGDSTQDTIVDQTVPLSRLGGAGWRDGGGAPAEKTSDAYAVESRSWGDDESVIASEPTLEHHVEVDNTGPRPAVEDDIDRERGGHW